MKVSHLYIRLKRALDQPIVNNASFSLQKGSALAIVGESGSGKTLTCKAVMRLLNARQFNISGSIRYNGMDLLEMSEKKIRALCGSKIAMVVQNPMTAFNPTVKIGAQMAETLRVHQKLRKKAAYELGIHALERMNLPRCEQLMNSYPYVLSGGMLQRITIALALIHEPDFIIADEATTALDVKNQQMVLEEFEKMKRRGIGLLLVTHDFGVAAKLADDMLVMRRGKIIERGTVYDLFSAPQQTYTKELLDASMLRKEKCM
nr:ABC transporter ATP-binding protein [Gracilibacillus alcaliphilus]